jgi:hypothetical protein
LRVDLFSSRVQVKKGLSIHLHFDFPPAELSIRSTVAGILRKLVRRKLKEYTEIKNVFHPEHFEGGDGVTIAEM